DDFSADEERSIGPHALRKLRNTIARTLVRAMRPTGNRLSALVSVCYRRPFGRVSELGLEVFRNDRSPRRSSVETNESISRRPSRPLRASAAPLPPRKHSLFLRSQLLG